MLISLSKSCASSTLKVYVCSVTGYVSNMGEKIGTMGRYEKKDKGILEKRK